MKENKAHYFIFTVSLRILRDLSEVMGTSGFYATRKKVVYLQKILDLFLGFEASTKLSAIVALNDVVDTLYRVKKITD